MKTTINKLKSRVAILLACTVLFCSSVSAAVPQVNYLELANTTAEELGTLEAERYEAQFMEMSDEEFDYAIAELVSRTEDYENLKHCLALCNVELGEVKSIAMPLNPSDVSPYKLSISKVSIDVYSTKRGGEGFYRLISSLIFTDTETRPAGLDAMVMYFDSTEAEYYSYNTTGSCVSLRSSREADNGTLIFNFDDNEIVPYTSYVASVYVIPCSSTSEVDYCMEYTHSYTTTNAQTSLDFGVEYGGTGEVTGSAGVSITFGNGVESWTIADSATLYLQ